MLRRALRRLRKLAKKSTARMRSWSGWVWHRIIREPGYIESVAALAVAVVELFCNNPAVRRVVHQTARTFVVVLRDLLHDDLDGGLAWT